MARRRDNNTLGMLLDLLSVVPWWCGVGAAVVFYLIFTVWLGHDQGKDLFKQATQMICRALGYIFAGVSLVGAAISAGKSLWRRNLLDAQSDIDSVRNLGID